MNWTAPFKSGKGGIYSKKERCKLAAMAKKRAKRLEAFKHWLEHRAKHAD